MVVTRGWALMQVQQQWLMFTERLDDSMLGALRRAVKRSLAELSRAINGDSKTEVVPLFYAALELERSFGASETVELRPTLQELANMIRSVSRELLQVRHISCFERTECTASDCEGHIAMAEQFTDLHNELFGCR